MNQNNQAAPLPRILSFAEIESMTNEAMTAVAPFYVHSMRGMQRVTVADTGAGFLVRNIVTGQTKPESDAVTVAIYLATLGAVAAEVREELRAKGAEPLVNVHLSDLDGPLALFKGGEQTETSQGRLVTAHRNKDTGEYYLIVSTLDANGQPMASYFVDGFQTAGAACQTAAEKLGLPLVDVIASFDRQTERALVVAALRQRDAREVLSTGTCGPVGCILWRTAAGQFLTTSHTKDGEVTLDAHKTRRAALDHIAQTVGKPVEEVRALLH